MRGGRRRSAGVLLAVALAVGGAAQAQASSAPRTGHAPAAATKPAPLARGKTTAALSLPDVPLVTSVVAEGLGLLVSWNPDAPAEAASSYTINVSPAPGDPTPPAGCAGPFTLTVDGSNSAGLVEGLCIGVAYVAAVSATNTAGSSAVSPASSPVVPLAAQVPEAPLISSVVGRDSSLVVSWSPPANDGGKAIAGYRLRAVAGSSTVTASAGPSATSATIGGLSNGTSYSVSLLASNGVGSSPRATGLGTPKAAYRPGGPSEVTATPDGSGAVAVSWSAPVDDGGDALTGSTVTWQQVVPGTGGGWVPPPGSSPQAASAGASATSLTIPASGFTPAAALYSVTVAASNAIGAGQATATANPVAPVTTVSTKTVVLTSATLAALASDTAASPGPGSVLYWPAPAPAQVRALRAGKVVVAAPARAAPQGLLDQVVSVTKDSAKDYTVTTSPASVNSVFSSLALATTSNPLTAPGSANRAGGPAIRFRPATAGVRNLTGRPRASVSFTPHLDIGFDLSTGDNGGFVSGEIDLQPDVSLSLNLDHGFAGIPDGVNLSASASVKVTDSLQVGIQGSYEHQIGDIPSPPIDIQVGPVPVVVEPDIPIFITVSGQIGVSVTATATIGASMAWNSHSPNTLSLRNLSSAGVSGGPIPGLSVTGEVDAGLSVQPQIRLYDLAGPNIEGDLLAVANVDVAPPPGGAYLTITSELLLKAGFDVDILDGAYHASLEVPLATIKGKTFVILKAPNAVLTISPADPQVLPGQGVQFVAARTDGAGGHPVTWSLGQAAGDTISPTGLFSAVNPPGRPVTVYAVDDTGAAGQTTVTIGTPFDSVGNLTAVQDSSDLGAQVSWSAPANTGGSPIAGYTVTVSGGIGTQSTTSAGVSLANLHPGITYTITVYPSNSSGQTGPPATTTLYVIPLCTDTFTGAGEGKSWASGLNWSTGKVPTAAEWVCTDGYTITLPAARLTVQGLQEAGTLTIPTGGMLIVTNDLALTGDLTGAGSLTVAAGSSATLGRLFNLIGGVRLINEGSMEIRTGAVCSAEGFFGGSVLENAAALTLDDGAKLIDCDGNGANQVINDAGATITYNGSSSGASAAISVPFTDAGAISVGAGTLYVNVSNGGDTTVLTGSPSISGPGTTRFGDSVSVPAAVTLTGPWTLSGELTGAGSLTVPTGSSATLEAAFELAGGVRLINEGSMEIRTNFGCSAGFYGGSVLENAAALTLDDGANLIDCDGNGANQVINDAGATITYNGSSSGASAAISVAFTDAGTVSVSRGTLTVHSLSNLSSGVLTGGIYSVTGGALRLPGLVTTNAAAMLIGSSGSITSGGSDALSDLASNTGSLTLARSLTTSATLSNTGTVSINAGTLRAPAYSQTAGSTVVAAGATIQAGSSGAGSVTVNGGTIGGNGTIAGAVGGGGSVVPGRAAGPLSVSGSYTPTGVGSLVIGISGSTSPWSDYAQLAVTGTATLAGTLALQTAAGYLPTIGTTVTILTSGQRIGTFSGVTGAQLSGEHWAVSYTAAGVTLTATSG